MYSILVRKVGIFMYNDIIALIGIIIALIIYCFVIGFTVYMVISRVVRFYFKEKKKYES